MRQEVTHGLRRTLFQHAFPKLLPKPQGQGNMPRQSGEEQAGLCGRLQTPHATCEPGKTTLPTQARQARTKHCWGEGEASAETRNLNSPAVCQAPLSSWLCTQRKCTAAIKHCVCVRACAQWLSRVRLLSTHV